MTLPLEDRIQAANWLGFHYASGQALAAIAALKGPSPRHREYVFQKAAAGVSPADYEHELGWVFVVPDHRGRGIAGSLCRDLMSRVPASFVFATTRPDNESMKKILGELGFAPVGRPYDRRDEQLVLYLRPSRSNGAEPSVI